MIEEQEFIAVDVVVDGRSVHGIVLGEAIRRSIKSDSKSPLGVFVATLRELQPATSLLALMYECLEPQYVPVLLDDARFKLSVAANEPGANTKIQLESREAGRSHGWLQTRDRELDLAQAVGKMALGDVAFVYGERKISTSLVDGDGVLFVVLGVMPWFAFTNGAAFSRGAGWINWRSVLANEDYRSLQNVPVAVNRLCRARPLLPLSDEALDDTFDCGAMVQQLLSFVLRWHMIAEGDPPHLVNDDSQAPFLERAKRRTDSGDAAAAESLDEWRERQAVAALERRSLRFFAQAAPRDALFANGNLWYAMTWIMRNFVDARARQFVLNQVCAAFRHIALNEVLKTHGELALMHLFREFLQPLAEAVEMASAMHAADEISEIAATVISGRPEQPCYKIGANGAESPGSPLDYRRIRRQVALDSAEARRAHLDSEPVDILVCSGLDLLRGDGTTSVLSAAQLQFLSLNDEDTTLESITNAVIMSFNFFAADRLLRNVLFTDNRIALKRDLVQRTVTIFAVLRAGRVYCNFDTTLDVCVELLRQFLETHARAGRLRAETDIEHEASALETRFVAAMPLSAKLYASDRSTEFDDVALGSDEYAAVYRLVEREQLARFMRDRVALARLPASEFDCAAFKGLSRAHQHLQQQRRRAYTLHSVENGPIEISELALLGVLHTDRCHAEPSQVRHRRPPVAIEYENEHINVRYDTDGDERKRAIRAREMRAQLSSGRRRAQIDALPELVTQVQRQARSSTDDELASSTTVNRASPLLAIEDLVGNMDDNRALPLCMRQFTDRILHKGEYLKEKDRLALYRLLASTELPELSHEYILRHMIQNSPPNKIGEHVREANGGYEKMLEKRREDAIGGFIRRALANSREVSREEAAESTTCAPSCSTLTNESFSRRHYCPLIWQNKGQLQRLIEASGVDAWRANSIATSTLPVGTRCRMHLESSRPSGTAATPVWTEKTRDVYIRHPYQFVYLAADHRLRHQEQLHRNAASPASAAEKK